MSIKKTIRLRKFTCFLCTAFLTLNMVMASVYAAEDAEPTQSSDASSENAFTGGELVDVPALVPSGSAKSVNDFSVSNSSDSIEQDRTLGQIDISAMLTERTTNFLPDNPRLVLEDHLTPKDINGIHIFTLTGSKYLVSKLSTESANCSVRIYFADLITGTLTPSNIAANAGNLMAVNNVPAGNYAFVVTSSDSAPNVDYNLAINAANPSGTVKTACWLTNDLQEFGLLYTSGYLYSNGTLTFNIGNPTQVNNLEWSREEDTNWGTGYRHREQSIYNVQLDSTKPIESYIYKYNASSVSSDYALILNLGVGTGYKCFQSAYESGAAHTTSFVDIFDKLTPRNLDSTDFNTGYGDLQLIYDLKEGKVIDFYGPLNLYYGIGAESATASPLTQILN